MLGSRNYTQMINIASPKQTVAVVIIKIDENWWRKKYIFHSAGGRQ